MAVGGNKEKAQAKAGHASGSQNPEPSLEFEPPYPDIDVGAIVDVKGKLTIFREEMQIKIEKMVGLKSTEQEIALWEKRRKFRREVLEKPWVLRDKDIRRCRREAERSEDALRSKEEAERDRKRRWKAAAERAAERATSRFSKKSQEGA